MITPIQGAVRKLKRVLPLYFGPGRFIRIAHRKWASINFTGIRFEIVFQAEEGHALEFDERVELAQIRLPRFLVAEVQLEQHPVDPSLATVDILALDDPEPEDW